MYPWCSPMMASGLGEKSGPVFLERFCRRPSWCRSKMKGTYSLLEDLIGNFGGLGIFIFGTLLHHFDLAKFARILLKFPVLFTPPPWFHLGGKNGHREGSLKWCHSLRLQLLSLPLLPAACALALERSRPKVGGFKDDFNLNELDNFGIQVSQKNTHHIDAATQPGHSSCLHWHSTCCPGHPTCPGCPIAPVHSNSLAQPTFGKALAIWSPTSANDLPLQGQKKTPEKNSINWMWVM